MKRLEGKVALITGGARGIGLASAQLFVAHGAQVIITDILDAEGQALADSLGEHAMYLSLDVAEPEQWDEIHTQVDKHFGRLDIMFNNAGITGLSLGPQNPEHIALEDWDNVHRINVDSVMLGCQHAIKLMKNTGGSIVNMASRSGMVGVPGACAYASSKAAIRNHTKSVALYCASMGYNIRCNALFPAAVMTPIWDDMLGVGPEREKNLRKVTEGIPLKRMGTPEEVAYAALFLASDESSYMTGSEIIIDGGILAGASSTPSPKD